MEMLSVKINECYNSMEKASRVILRAGLAVIGAMYLTAIAAFVCCDRFFPDYDTALCFIAAVLECAKELSGAVIVPVMLYETLGRAIVSR